MNEKMKAAIALTSKVQSVMRDVETRHIGRADVVQATFLALVSGRPAFFLGSPGTDKTGAVQDMARQIAGAVFYDVLMPTIVSVEQLLVESTSIEEASTAGGGKSIRTRDTLGRAALAHLLFADEIWKAEPRVLQTLIDLSKGDGVRHEGQMVATPLLAFLAASNELPEAEGNLGAIWSRMTIRVVVNPLDRAGKNELVKARLARATGGSKTATQTLTLADIETLRTARKYVDIPQGVIDAVLDVYQELVDDKSTDFSWAWADDRRFGRVFDVMQAKALLDGRTVVSKQDLAVLEWLLWDVPEHIPVVKAKLAPYCRTPFSDAQEAVDALLTPGGVVELVRNGDRVKGVQAITQCEAALTELKRLKGEADSGTSSRIADLVKQVEAVKDDVIAVVTGAKMPQRGN
ncbi:MAG: MoxR family ATPase [bacterium]|nr:MoxR family ATPase [bacterium]